MTTLTKQQNRALTEIVVEQLDAVIGHVDSVLEILKKARGDMEALISRAEPAEAEEINLLLQDMEQTLTVDIEQSKANAERLIKRLQEGTQSPVELKSATWDDIERTIRLLKKYKMSR